MKDVQGLLDSIWKTYHIPYTMFDASHKMIVSSHGISTIDVKINFFRRLIEISEETLSTHIIIDLVNSSAACIFNKATKEFIVLGIIFVGVKSKDAIITSLRKCRYSEQQIELMLKTMESVPVLSLSEFQNVVRLIYQYIHHESLDMKDVVIYKENKEIKNEIRLDIPNRMNSVNAEIVNEERQAHDSYAFERNLLQCVRDGDVKRLITIQKYSGNVDIGTLTRNHDELRQLKNTLISATTICTRAAIEGGLSPAIAYALSDYYIQNSEAQIEINNVQRLIQEMFLDFTQRVQNVKVVQAYSEITRRCIAHINEHIREDIDYQAMADHIGITKNYMLAKFKKDTNESMVDYIKAQKIKEAKELLKFSEYSIVEISERLSFSSQSFFTSCFHAICGMTPKQYRDAYKLKEDDINFL